MVGIDGREFVLADIPGLIEGAHEGVGLGDRFLGHVERCRVLLHLIDGTEEDAGAAYRTVRDELAAYGQGLAAKQGNCCPEQSRCVDRRGDQTTDRAAETRGEKSVFVISAVSGKGVREVLRALMAVIEDARGKSEPKAEHAAWQP